MSNNIPSYSGRHLSVTTESEDEDDSAITPSHVLFSDVFNSPRSGRGKAVSEEPDHQHRTTSPETGPLEDLAADEDTKHPYYDYVHEKSDSHADAKLIFLRHRMDTKTEQDMGSPQLLAKSMTMPSSLEGDQALSKQKSTGSQSSHRKEAFPPLQTSIHNNLNPSESALVAADVQARSHKHHPQLPHEFKGAFLSEEGVHGAGAGVGLGTGPGGLAWNDESIVSEVKAICEKIKTVLDFRRQYLKVSLQCPGDNPKDDEEWDIYPPPPEPVWTQEKVRPPPRDMTGLSRASSGLYMQDSQANIAGLSKVTSASSPNGIDQSDNKANRKFRKPGQDIGSDFDINECEIPEEAPDSLDFKIVNGVYQVRDSRTGPIVQVPTLRDYYMALDTILDIASDGPAKSFAYRRLQYLEGRYNLYTLLNEYEEVADTKKVPHRDFYNVRKVDTHVHHSACMNQKHLLRFIKSKMKKCPDDPVIARDGTVLTLDQVFQSINLTAYDLSIDTLDMHAHTDSFHRFDKFNLKYNPIGQSRLRDIFLKTDNFIKGRYLAEITREVISDLESSKYQMVEWRISIYGRKLEDWDNLAAWVVDNKLFSHNVRWLIQIPRLYSLYKSMNTVENFEQLIRNIFQPLFEVTKDPSSHPKLHIFLQRVIGFDSVDDESKPERRLYRKFPEPEQWNTKQNPPYGYWLYYLYANLTSLNAWRKRRNFNTFLLRPHCGEAGDTDHLAAALLCCHSISHGITLRKVPLLQYVFYLDQIGIAMSPLSNNALFLTYDRNPFISYFKKGLNVSLSTDDPLQFAFTKEPLIEEYSVAAQIYKLSAVDMCELAKHSVDQCGFELSLKRRWLGKYSYLPGVAGNDVAKCNVPDVREAFRHETLVSEHAFIAKYTTDYTHLDRCNPSIVDPTDPTTPIAERQTVESPRQYFNTVADSIPEPQSARQLPSRSSNHAESLSGSPKRSRTSSTAITPLASRTSDGHISGYEPRFFPGAVHQRERRKSIRASLSGSDHGVQDVNSSLQLEPGLAKMTVREDSELAQLEDSD